jgi:hypothetical protein
MRSILLAAVCALAACGDDGTHDVVTDLAVAADLSQMGTCPPGAEQLHGATCRYGVDGSCHSRYGYDCHCLCDGYWECDAILCVPDDAGLPHD